MTEAFRDRALDRTKIPYRGRKAFCYNSARLSDMRSQPILRVAGRRRDPMVQKNEVREAKPDEGKAKSLEMALSQI